MVGNVQETIGYLAGAPPAQDGLQFARFIMVAAATLYLYDILITLDLEVRLLFSSLHCYWLIDYTIGPTHVVTSLFQLAQRTLCPQSLYRLHTISRRHV